MDFNFNRAPFYVTLSARSIDSWSPRLSHLLPFELETLSIHASWILSGSATYAVLLVFRQEMMSGLIGARTASSFPRIS
jgi:hypothetical protein